ncbi:MAG: hypothetical protein KDL87_14785, partial [Verrucomicrobiae bacterium]|nr:hypothetical protein [Verrucomicrobiae bacterium]
MKTRSIFIAVAIIVSFVARLSANAQDTPPRLWTNAANGRTVEAVLLAVEGTNIRFRTKDDRVFTLPVSRLVQSDQEFVANWAKERGKTPVTAT